MIEGRIKRRRDELNERNEEIDILKGEASKQINQIRGSITKFLDKETGTLGERIKTLFREQGVTIASILTAIGMAVGVLIEALLGGSTTTITSGSTSGGDGKGSIMKFLDKETRMLGERIKTLFREQGVTIASILTAIGMAVDVLTEALLGGSTTTITSGSTSGGDGKGSGAREWIKNKLKALSRLLDKLADKALASLPGIIGAILLWILNRAKDIIGFLSQNWWALITGVGVLVYTYFMTKTRRR